MSEDEDSGEYNSESRDLYQDLTTQGTPSVVVQSGKLGPKPIDTVLEMRRIKG